MNFDEVYDKYVDIVYAFLKQRIQDSYLVEDIVQDTFLSVYENSHVTFFTRKKGISAFKKELLSSEIEQNAVEELAAEYKKIIQINQWVNLFTELKEKEQS